MPVNEIIYPTIATAAQTLAEDIAIKISSAVKQRGQAIIAVSGGQTPRHVFSFLRTKKLAWEKVIITLTDERWVPPCNPDSNESLVRKELLQGDVAQSSFISLYDPYSSTPEQAQSECDQKVRRLPLPFDAVYLGMGEDGHFASLFPETNIVNLASEDKLCVPVPETSNRCARMSLSTSALLNSKQIYLLIQGEKKYSVYQQALKATHAEELPIQIILSQKQVPVSVYIV